MSEDKKLKTEHFSCKNCGAEAEFDPKTQTLVCPYCMSSYAVDNTQKTTEKNIDDLFQNAKVWDNVESIRCENCGATETITKGEIATNCPFCGTTNIVRSTEITGLKPHGLCPFLLTNDQAGANAKQWAKKKVFAPNDFRKSAEPKAIKGLYSPAFTFDCSTETIYKGVLGERIKDREGRYSHTRYFDIKGNHSMMFDDVIVHVASNIPNVSLDKLGDYPTNSAVEYDQKYLAGYTANSYAKDGEAAWKMGKEKIDNRIKKQVLSKYTYDVVKSFDADTKYNNRSFKYLLLPVYVGHHKYKNKDYNFYVNGSTGKVAGKAPVSFWKVLFTVLGSIALIALIVYLSIK